LLASVDVITKEEVIRLGRKAAVLEQAEEIIVLAVNVTADLRAKKCQLKVLLRVFGDPQRNTRTLMGASSSSRMGWEMKISRALVHR
jgi:hypothetical protein